MVPDADYRIKLPAFEGPLDLLLFLIRKNEIDIYDIPIESVTKQYIAVLRSMQQLDLDVAGEFFVMAATLMEIKSRLLLPRGQAAVGDSGDDEDAMDPRWELVHQLLQYKKFKEAATKLDELVAFQQGLLARHVSKLTISEHDRPLKPSDRIDLWNAFNLVLRRLAEKLVVGEIREENVTVSDRMEWLLERVQSKPTYSPGRPPCAPSSPPSLPCWNSRACGNCACAKMTPSPTFCARPFWKTHLKPKRKPTR